MTLKERILGINERLKAIEVELKEADLGIEKISTLNKEVDSLINKRAEFTVELKGEINEKFKEANPADPDPKDEEGERALNIKAMSKRDKISYMVGKGARGKTLDATEKRALGTSLTTTAATFVEATEHVDGVNNAGVFIPTRIIFDLLREEGKLSPILADISFSNIAGLTQFPYREERTKANAKAEGEAGVDGQVKWNKLELTKGYLQTIIAVTDEVLALTDFGLGEYITSQLLEDISEDWVEDLIYGTGDNEHIKGITIGATAATTTPYSGDAGDEVLDAIIAGIKKSVGKFRRGAKVYVAQDVYDEIFFAVDDNGNFRYPVLNNAQGISSIGPIRVELDENLKAGQFLIGNVNKYFKANTLINLRLETNRIARRGVTEWIASEFCATAPFVGAFILGTKEA